MRCRQRTEIQQFAVQLWLAFPDIEHSNEIRIIVKMLQQGIVINNGPTASINQAGICHHLLQLSFTNKVPGRVIAALLHRCMQTDNITSKDFIERRQLTDVVLFFEWITGKHRQAHLLQTLAQKQADITHTDNADTQVTKINPATIHHNAQSTKNIVNYGLSVTSWRTCKPNSGVFQILKINMIGTDGCRTNKFYGRTLKQLSINLSYRADK